MARKLDLTKSVHDLAREYPDFVDVMVELGFTDISKPAALNTVGRVMTVPKGAAIKGIRMDEVVKAFEAHGFEVSLDGVAAAQPADGASPDVSRPSDDGADGTIPTEGPKKVEGLDEAGRARLLESYVNRLSQGEPLESVRAEFVANFEDVDAAEIARAEQNLIQAGAKIDDVQRLCDVHSALFHGATREERIQNAENAVMDSLASATSSDDFKTKVLAAIPGHPVNVFTRENEAIAQQIARAREALDTEEAASELGRLTQLGIHYAKKGDLLYPILKTRYDFSGPSDVMWGVDDEIRAELRAVATTKEHDASWRERAEKVLTRADEMIYKETNILLPLCVKNFSDEEWLQMYADMKGYDLCLLDDAGTWQTGEEYLAGLSTQAARDAGDNSDTVVLPTGQLTASQLDAVLNTLPFEITFIDDHEINRYWNDDGHKKLFKRPASALGREVWSCHPPKVQTMVRNVIDTLKAGGQDSVDIWMQKEGEPVLVRYMAVRNREGTYVGTMECVQRLGFAQQHFAQG